MVYRSVLITIFADVQMISTPILLCRVQKLGNVLLTVRSKCKAGVVGCKPLNHATSLALAFKRLVPCRQRLQRAATATTTTATSA